MRDQFHWARILSFVTGLVNQELLLRNELYHQERNHQGKGNVILFPASPPSEEDARGALTCWERLGGLLKYYRRAA
jgi:hypothetical protein